MLLSDAIIAGDSMLDERSMDVWLTKRPSGRWAGCALGGALLAIGKAKRITDWKDFLEFWPWLTQDHVTRISLAHALTILGSRPIAYLRDYVRLLETSTK